MTISRSPDKLLKLYFMTLHGFNNLHCFHVEFIYLPILAKAFSFSGPLLDVLANGKVLFVDELDARFHPIITQAIVQMFHDPRTNPQNAQLIFATHDTNLLDNKFFRRDQVWFMEKNKYGATDLYSLVDFKVRNDASFEKDYVAGKYGAIPFLGGLQRLGA